MCKADVQFLGKPTIFYQGKEQTLRSEKTWGVLSSLLLPCSVAAVSEPSPSLPLLSRTELAKRFWKESIDPKNDLRQALASIRSVFHSSPTSSLEKAECPDCLICVGDRVQAVAAAFQTDIGHIQEAYQRSCQAQTQEERLAALLEAEPHLRGGFLEGFGAKPHAATLWIIKKRHEITPFLVSVLADLAEVLEETGNLRGAMDATERLLKLLPDDAAAEQKLWELARKTGQERAAEIISEREGYAVVRQHAALLERQNLRLTAREGRHFERLFSERLEQFEQGEQKKFRLLSLLPNGFAAEIAAGICGIAPALLYRFLEYQLIEQDEEGSFFLLDAIKERVTPRISAATRQRFFTKLAAFIAAANKNGFQLFGTQDKAKPLILSACNWIWTQPPTKAFCQLLFSLYAQKYLNCPDEIVAYFERAIAQGKCSDEMQYDLLCSAAAIVAPHDRRTARAYYEQALSLPFCQQSETRSAIVHQHLAFVCHHTEDSKAAIAHCRHAIALNRALENRLGEASNIRFLGEIQISLGELDAGMASLDEALSLLSSLPQHAAALAEALHWKGKILERNKQEKDSLRCFEDALQLWQRDGNQHGIAHCLVALASIRSKQGFHGEAQSHLEYAILLYEGIGAENSRAAAWGIFGDLRMRQGRRDEALSFYEAGLAFWKREQHADWMETFHTKIAQCRAIPCPTFS